MFAFSLPTKNQSLYRFCFGSLLLSACVINLAGPNSLTSLVSIVRHCHVLEFDV